MSNPNQRRDSHGRFKPDHRTRNLAIGAATVVGVGAAAVVGALKAGLFDRFFPTMEGMTRPTWHSTLIGPAPTTARPTPSAPIPPPCRPRANAKACARPPASTGASPRTSAPRNCCPPNNRYVRATIGPPQALKDASGGTTGEDVCVVP